MGTAPCGKSRIGRDARTCSASRPGAFRALLRTSSASSAAGIASKDIHDAAVVECNDFRASRGRTTSRSRPVRPHDAVLLADFECLLLCGLATALAHFVEAVSGADIAEPCRGDMLR